MVAPVIYTFGNEEQKARFLPRILKSEDWWCQGYSEPGSGSDLASLKTKAELDGDHYVVNGAKIWTTYAQHADWIFCLVRTNNEGKKQQGISFLLIDMTSEGVKVNPIESIDNHHSLNEVEFNNVRVPVSNLIGEQDKGWTYAKALLAHERTGIAGVADSKRALGEVRRFAEAEMNGGKALIDDPLFQKRLSDVEIELMALEFTDLRVLSAGRRGRRAGCGVLPAQDQGHGDPAAGAGAAYGRGRLLPGCAAHGSAERSDRPRFSAAPRARATCTDALRPSTAARTRSRRTSSPRPCWACRRRSPSV
jgi:alkylation response protein AidB-like acyl-CoA dehydrogenase